MARLWRRKGTAAACGCVVGEDRGVPSCPRLCSLFPEEQESWLLVVICSGKGVAAPPGAGRTREAARSARLTVKGGNWKHLLGHMEGSGGKGEVAWSARLRKGEL